MANLTSIERLKLEKLLEMGGGYVLDFTNRSLQEFILENLSINIYDEKYDYHSGSKANRLRAFWKQESNFTVGVLLESLLEYWEAKRLINQQGVKSEDKILLEDCQSISKRLKGEAKGQDCEHQGKDDDFSLMQSELSAKFDEFATLISAQDKRQRGFLLEDLLERAFSLYSIQTQKSFKRHEGGEQIDGAFKLESWYYLVECKWTEKLTDIRQLDSLYGKVGRSGKQTLGLFLSINGWSKNVTPLLKQNHEKSIILMDGYDLRCVLVEHNSLSLKNLLLKKLECLNFEGEPFFSAANLI